MTCVGGRDFSSIVMALATALVVAACGSTAPSSPPGSPPAASGAASSAATIWQRLEVDEPFYGGAFEGAYDEVTSGVAYGNGFVLVGRSEDEAGGWRGGVWSTPDGMDWTRVADDEGIFDGMYLAHVATDGTRLLALGWRTPWGDAARRGPYVAWVSDDGARWERHEIEQTELGRIYAEGIVGSRSGFLAWGPTADGPTALLRSLDGLAWQSIDYPGAADSHIADVTPYGGGFLAVGGEHRDGLVIGGPSAAARAWSSPDGQQWLSAAVPSGWSLSGVYPAAGGVLAVGAKMCSRCVGPNLAWQSADGRSWSLLGDELALSPFVGANGSQVAVFDWQDDRSIALSSDGLNWQKVVANLPAAEYDAGLIVGSMGVLLLVAKIPIGPDGVQDIHAGVLFLRGS